MKVGLWQWSLIQLSSWRQPAPHACPGPPAGLQVVEQIPPEPQASLTPHGMPCGTSALHVGMSAKESQYRPSSSKHSVSSSSVAAPKVVDEQLSPMRQVHEHFPPALPRGTA